MDVGAFRGKPTKIWVVPLKNPNLCGGIPSWNWSLTKSHLYTNICGYHSVQ